MIDKDTLKLIIEEMDRTPKEQTMYPSEFSQLCEDWLIDNAKEVLQKCSNA